jgi:hypothetical protein
MTSNIAYAGPGDMPESIPVFPLSGALLLPRGQMPLNIFEPRYLAMFDAAIASDRLIGIVQPLAETTPAPSAQKSAKIKLSASHDRESCEVD